MTSGQLVLGVAGWCAGWLLAGRARRLRASPAGALVRTSVIIPARNEADRLPGLLEALAASRPLEVIVVDDASTDGTDVIAQAGGARVLAPPEPPPGWTGKTWACATGAAASTGATLVFLDADVEPAPGALEALVDEARRRGGLVSCQPEHIIERLYERCSAGPAVVTLLGAGLGVAPRRSRWRGPVAFGPAIAIARASYESFDGHGAVRGAIDDDLALARVAAAADVPVVALLGGRLLRYRMYPDGMRALIEGWSKNLATGAQGIPRARLLATVTWVAGALGAAIAVTSDVSVIALVLYAAYALHMAVMLRRVGRFGVVTAILYPLPLMVFVALFARSWFATRVRRQVSWRGRDVTIGPRP
jgi:4,4'-diaponeurosporenoate glycosyltransferase